MIRFQGDKVSKRDFPKIHFYDQDFVDIYDKSWAWISDFWRDSKKEEHSLDGYFVYPNENGCVVDQLEAVFSSFFLVYSNRNYAAQQNLDYLYERQEENGAIRWKYNLSQKIPVVDNSNPEGIGMPLFAWAEFNLFHKTANKKRIKDVLPVLQKYSTWLETNFKRENNLYEVPHQCSTMFNSPRDGTVYPIDFNAAMATHALYMAALGDIINDKDINFQYKKMYFSLKTHINAEMWDNETGFYYDLDKDGNKLMHRTIANFWPLIAEIPNEDKAERMISYLSDPNSFGTEHPFPTLSADNPHFRQDGEGYKGSVYPAFNFMVIKGLEKYQRHELAREAAIRHLYFILDGLVPEGSDKKGDLWEAYLPSKEGFAKLPGNENFPKKRHIIFGGLSTIAVMIENIIGLNISLPRKTVDWTIPNLETMGIENLSLTRNMISILSNKSNRGWEILMESEKLYYFTINILGEKKKTLPIPSGKCSMLIDKL